MPGPFELTDETGRILARVNGPLTFAATLWKVPKDLIDTTTEWTRTGVKQLIAPPATFKFTLETEIGQAGWSYFPAPPPSAPAPRGHDGFPYENTP